MSRCRSCDRIMNDFEMTRKYEDGTYVDMCSRCFKASEYDKPVIVRADLYHVEETDVLVCTEDYLDD